MAIGMREAIAELERLPDYWQERVTRKLWVAIREERTDMALWDLEARERSEEGNG